jgi:NADPH:quinone reductase-like Zn-dependent oxidoreductase
VVLPARQLFRYPDSLTPAEAAAIPVVFLTAWVALFRSGNARPGETALVLVAGGGVGSAAVQLAVHHGMRVIGTAGSERKRKFGVRWSATAASTSRSTPWAAATRQPAGGCSRPSADWCSTG